MMTYLMDIKWRCYNILAVLVNTAAPWYKAVKGIHCSTEILKLFLFDESHLRSFRLSIFLWNKFQIFFNKPCSSLKNNKNLQLNLGAKVWSFCATNETTTKNVKKIFSKMFLED